MRSILWTEKAKSNLSLSLSLTWNIRRMRCMVSGVVIASIVVIDVVGGGDGGGFGDQ